MSNDHIGEYLNYYVALPLAPGYAVMINGPWGIGKTYYIKAVADQLKQEGKKIFWVSLYGVQSTDEIDQRLIAALTPYMLGKVQEGVAMQAPAVDEFLERGKPYLEKARPMIERAAKYGGRLGSALIKRMGAGGLLQASGLRNIVTPDLIVFDDLERGSMPAKDLLGYINQFVELEGRKVVIVANEKEVINGYDISKENEDYLKVREKVIGETFEFQEDIEAALQAFIAAMPGVAAKGYVEKYIEVLRSILKQSECKSLRVLRQVLLTWDRFYEAIDPKLREQTNPMLTVFRLFTAICTEVRLGHLSAEDLTDRVFKIVSSNMANNKEDPTPLAKADSKYPELFLHDTVLSDDVLVHVICEGRVNRDEIDASLRQSAHFKAPQDEPAWQKVWWGIGRDPEEFESAFTKMEAQFKAREFTEPGTLLHVFGLRLWGTDIGQLKMTKCDVVSEARQYVDDLTKANRLLGAKVGREYFRHGAADGLGFLSVESEAFKGLRDYYWNAVEEAKKQRWPSEAATLLELMNSDVSAFITKIAWTSGAGENIYQSVPLFSSIPASDFVDKLMLLRPKDFRTVSTALKERYSGNKLEGELQPEKAWLREVRDLLLKKADEQVPIRKFAIRNEVGRLLSPFFSEE